MIFLDLPFEILLEIAQYINIEDSCSLLRINKYLHTVLVGDWMRSLVRHHQDFALGLAVLHHKTDVIRRLVALGADVNHPSKIATDESGLKFEMPLHIAAVCSTVEMVRLLLELGANVEVQNSKGRTPLHDAILRPDLDIVKEITRRTPHSSSFVVDHVRHATALHAAAKLGLAELVSIFLERNLDVRVRDASGLTALQYAKLTMKWSLWGFKLDMCMNMNCFAETVRILVALGEDPHIARGLTYAWATVQELRFLMKLLRAEITLSRPES